MDKDKYRDKRDHRRFDTSEESWASVDNSGRTSIKNISLSGICLVITLPLDKDSVHEIDIYSGGAAKITLHSLVAWSSFLGVSGINSELSYYETGFQFIDMDEGAKNRLEKFIASLDKMTLQTIP